MTDIFDTKIICKKCEKEMKPVILARNGAELRAVKCINCNDQIIHPADQNCLRQFEDLKGKTFNVKLRVVGNSHAISIPKEIVTFMNSMQKSFHKEMDDMVKLAFEDFGRLRIDFWEHNLKQNRRIKEYE